MNETEEVEAFEAAAASSARMFWLDGGGARPWSGSRSVLGALADDDVSLTFDAATREVHRHRSGTTEVVGDDVFAVLEEHVAADGRDPSVSWVGYLGYACRTDMPGRPAGSTTGVPDAVWMRLRDPLVLTPTRHSLRVDPSLPAAATTASGGSTTASGGSTASSGGSTASSGGSTTAGDGSTTASGGSTVGERRFGGYTAAFDEVQRQLRLGNSYEVNLTYREQVESGVDPVAAYLRLRAVNPAPYSGYLQHHGVHLLSSSPERFATVDRHRTIEAKPIKGTTPRGSTTEEDEEHRVRLATDPKYRAENLMIVDLMRNDLSMVCEPGSVAVPSLMEVESYESVHQLVSTVRGRLRGDVTTIGALRSIFPAGSMTGAPKRRTMEIIDAVEWSPRGVYAGAFGWISGDGRADLSVVIRSLVATGIPSDAGGAAVEDQGRPRWRYELGTGGGITVRSTAEEEYAETRWKAARLRTALQG